MTEETNVQTVRCPYCEDLITGDPLYIMNHGIQCRQQWETQIQQVENQSKNESN